MSTDGETPRSATSLIVLVVCTGNVFRSPAAELLLRSRLGEGSGIEVVSAGIAALAGEPVAAPMARLLGAGSADPAAFVARQLQPSDIRAADLVLTMTADQRRSVVTTVPSAVRRTFTLLEFTALAELAEIPAGVDAPADRAAAVLREAPWARARRQQVTDDDVTDPHGRSDEVVAQVFEVIDDAVTRMATVLRGPALNNSISTNAAPRRHGGNVA